jgi:hypothetical protein
MVGRWRQPAQQNVVIMMTSFGFKGLIGRLLGRMHPPPTATKQVPFSELERIIAWRARPEQVPDILVFGDSVMERVAREDSDRRSLGKMIADGVSPELRCEVFSFSAFHSEVFASLLNAIACLEVRPRCIVLPVNLRSFSPQWSFNPEFRFAEEIHLADSFVAGTLENEPRVYRSQDGKHPPARPEEWRCYHDRPVDFPGTPFRKVGDFLRLISAPTQCSDEAARRKQALFMFHYMSPLDEGHDKLRALRAAVDVALSAGSALVVYLTPINFQAGIQFAGRGFSERVASNARLIRNSFDRTVAGRTAKFLDLSAILGRSMFFDTDSATEHLNQAGREHLSREVCAAVNHLLIGDVAELSSAG